MKHVAIFLAALLLASAAHADNPLTPFPSPMTPPSAAPTNTAGFVSGTCGTTNAIAYFSAASTLTCNATLTTDGAGGLLVGGATTLGDASGDTVTSNATSWSFPNDTAVSLGGGVNGLNFGSDTLSLDGTSKFVGIGTAAPGAPLHIKKDQNADTSLFVENATAGAAALARLVILQNGGTGQYFSIEYLSSSFSPAGLDQPNRGKFVTNSGATNGMVFEAVAGPIILSQGGAVADERLRTTSSEVAVNDASQNVDFRVESDNNANMVFVDASADFVGIGTGSPTTELHVKHDQNASTFIYSENATAGTAAIAGLAAIQDLGTGKYFALQYLSSGFTGTGLQLPNQGKFVVDTGATNGMLFEAVSGPIVFAQGGVAASNERVRINSTEVIVNDNAQDVDFRAESTSNANMLLVNAGANCVDIGGSTCSAGSALTMTGDILPEADNTRSIGSDTLRFALVRATTVTTGDLVLNGHEHGGAKWRLVEADDRIVVVNEDTGERFHVMMEAE